MPVAMDREPSRWQVFAEQDLVVASRSLAWGFPQHAAFWCQQAAEKALKGACLDAYGELLRTHNLVTLARQLDAPDRIEEHCAELSALYVGTRYPDAVETYTARAVQRYLDQAIEVVEWTKPS